jgi:hypothetical protein
MPDNADDVGDLLEAREERAQALEPLIVEFQAVNGAIEARAIRCWRHRGDRHRFDRTPDPSTGYSPPSAPILNRA